LWSSPLAVFFLVFLLVQGPLDEGLVTGSGEEELRLSVTGAFSADNERGDPATVALKVTLVLESVLGLSGLAIFNHLIR